LISLVIPCHNEAENLSALYVRAAMTACANDGSTDNTLGAVAGLA